ncbi:MAG: hypothetical protein JNK40_06635 [Chromatiales bacterium]|nr:hypothetical protein [Chromatiales bacterium]
MNLIRIAGLMRSGSNLLTWMLRQNFADVQTATMLLGWKHGPIFRDKAELAIDDFVDPRYRAGIRNFVRDRAAEWARVTASPLFRAAADQQRTQAFGVALAVRDPGLWYASCVRIQRQAPDFLPHGTGPAEAADYWNERHRDWLATLGTRSVIVDTDALRRDPEPWLERMAAGLGVPRIPGVRLPAGYLHPQGTEEIYELLGAPITREMEREFTTLDAVDPADRARFASLLDRDLLQRLGLDGDRITA